MERPTFAFMLGASLLAIYAACTPAPVPFHQLRTPSGDFCSDMPIFAGRDAPDKEFHRIGPVKSAAKLASPAERLESLRKAACAAGADAVVEASEAEERNPDATFSMIASGTGVVWTRRPDAEAKALGLGSVSGKSTEGDYKEPGALGTAKDPAPVNTSVEVKPTSTAPTSTAPATTAATAPEPTPSATTAPATTTTTKTTTKTKTKTK